MYAINHAATALVIKKQYRATPMLWLLLAVQAIEVLWVILNYLGIEHIELVNGVVQLGYLPFSHSIVDTLILALLAWLIFAQGLRRPAIGIALAIGIFSHIVLDLIVHQADIAIAPFVGGPRFGLGLYNIPLLAFVVETIYGIACWWIYKGSGKLLLGIIVFNLLNLPLFFHLPFPPGTSLRTADLITTTIIAVQIVLTWTFVWVATRERPVPESRAS